MRVSPHREYLNINYLWIPIIQQSPFDYEASISTALSRLHEVLLQVTSEQQRIWKCKVRASHQCGRWRYMVMAVILPLNQVVIFTWLPLDRCYYSLHVVYKYAPSSFLGFEFFHQVVPFLHCSFRFLFYQVEEGTWLEGLFIRYHFLNRYLNFLLVNDWLFNWSTLYITVWVWILIIIIVLNFLLLVIVITLTLLQEVNLLDEFIKLDSFCPYHLSRLFQIWCVTLSLSLPL